MGQSGKDKTDPGTFSNTGTPKDLFRNHISRPIEIHVVLREYQVFYMRHI